MRRSSAAPGRNLRPQDAGAHIGGYTIFNDWSARDLQLAEMRLGLGPCKGKDFANTLGPWIVTADELEPYRDGDRLDLELRAEINGATLGTDTLANMAWSFEELVSYASRGTWVRPGDVLGSGTCGGGCLLELWGRHGRDGLRPLGPGDVVSLHVEGIGTLTNTVVAGVEPIPLPRARPRRADRPVSRTVPYERGPRELGDGLYAYLDGDGGWGLEQRGPDHRARQRAARRHAI